VLKILNRILRPTRGWCEVRGRVGALIEIAAGFHPDLTGRENVFLQGAIIGMPSAYIARRFDEIVEFSGIEPFIDTPVKRYSSGMNARLGFAIAAHLDPEVLVIDEVLAVGDLAFQQRCYDRLAQFRESGIPIAFVSHNMQAVAAVCDRVLLLRPGLPPLMGDVGEMLAAYVSSGAGAVEDHRVASCSSSLVRVSDGEPAVLPVEPHDELELRVRLRAAEELQRARFAFVLTRSDGTRMYDGFCAEPVTVDLAPGAEAEFTVRFRANLLRGTYIVGANLVDAERRWSNVRLGNLGSFVVHETESWSGCVAVDAVASCSLEPAADRVAAG
jgi:lipopolysaccharide transport system ATP-binding protein